jgi:acylphosphatase
MPLEFYKKARLDKWRVNMPRKHIIVSGRVQGVGFRYHARLLAEGLHLTGWVRNLDTGDVELELQGPGQIIEQFLSQLDKKSMFIRIDHMESEEMSEIHENSFEIIQDHF